MSTDPEAFIQLIRAQFGDEKDLVTLDHPFRDLWEWSSMQALIVITAIDEAYGVTIGEAELRKAQTFGDLFTLVKGS